MRALLALSGEAASRLADWAAAAAAFFFGENEMFFSFCSADDAGEGGGCMAGAPSSNWRRKSSCQIWFDFDDYVGLANELMVSLAEYKTSICRDA